MSWRAFIVFNLILMFLGWSQAGQAAVEKRSVTCWFKPVERVRIDCYRVIVPENRQLPDGRKVELAVGVMSPVGYVVKPDPVVMLYGGPGEHTYVNEDGSEALKGIRDDHAGLLKNRALILVDQRGIGYSKPSLNCTELEELAERDFDHYYTWAEAMVYQIEATQLCRDRLTAQGIELAAYNSQESAADIADVLNVLGYKQANLFGISYGTRLAMEVMHHFPELVRSAVLDGVYPSEVDSFASMPFSLKSSLDLLFADCRADPVCNQSFPGLEAKFYQFLAKLRQESLWVRIKDEENGGTKKREIDLPGLIGGLYETFYDEDNLSHLPALFWAATHGKPEVLYDYQSGLFDGDISNSEGMALSVECQDHFYSLSSAQAQTAKAQLPLFYSLLELGTTAQACAIWNVPRRPVDGPAKDLSSDVPALLLAGSYDPATPPVWAQVALKALPNATLLEFADGGHGMSVESDCAYEAMVRFINDPKADPVPACFNDNRAPRFDKTLE